MRSTTLALPDRTYWADPGRLLAGAYPGDAHPDVAEQKIRALLGVGVRTFVNLMEEDETNRAGLRFAPYAPHVERWAREAGFEAVCVRHPVRDLGVPSIDGMREIQATIDESLSRGSPVYVHCWGGKGRTGTAVGVYLIGRGLAAADDFVRVIAHLRVGDAGGGSSPETRAQIEFVRRYLVQSPTLGPERDWLRMRAHSRAPGDIKEASEIIRRAWGIALRLNDSTGRGQDSERIQLFAEHLRPGRCGEYLGCRSPISP